MTSKIKLGLRVLLALSFIVFGFNKFIHFIPTPQLEGTAGKLMGIYVESGFMKIIGLIEIIGGFGLLINKLVPLSLTLLGAIMFNAVIFHALYDISGIVNAIFAFTIVMLYVYFNRDRFHGILSV